MGRATLALAAIALGVKGLGLVEKLVIAHYFGIDERVDAFFVAVSVPIALFLFVREVVEPGFLPLFVQHLDAGHEGRAWRLFRTVGTWVALVTLPLAVAGWSMSSELASLLAPGFPPSTLEITARLIRVLIAGGVLLALSVLSYSALNGYRRFALPAAGDLVLKAAPTVGAVFLAHRLGVVALAFGALVGCGGRLLVHLVGLRRELRWPRGSDEASAEDRRTLCALMAPLALGMVLSQVSDLADNFFSSGLGPGSVAARTYARKIVDLPILLLPYGLSVVAFPYLSSYASRREWSYAYGFLAQTLRGLAMVFLALGVPAVILAEPIVALLLEHGAFDAKARELTAGVFRLYAAGLVTFAFEALLVPFYFALRDTRTPVVVGILGVLIKLGLIPLLIGSLGVAGVAAALTISKTVKVLLLGLLLKRKRPELCIAPVLATSFRLGLATGVAALGVYAVASVLRWPGPTAPLLLQLGYIAVASGCGGALFVGSVLAVASPERQMVLEWSAVVTGVVRRRIRGV